MEEKLINNKKRVGIYCRVSSREQALYGYGIDVQKQKITAHINLFDVETETITYYTDEGVSAKDLNRHDAKKMIQDIKDGKLDVVYIYKLDRLSRSVTDIYVLVELFTQHNCNLIAVMDNIDINSANGRLFVGILAIIAQWERETIVERTNDGLEEVARQRKWPLGKIPFGYLKNQDGKLEKNQNEVKIFESMVSNILEGYTVKETEKYILEETGLHIKAEAIKKILKKTIYYGSFVYKGKEYLDMVPALYTKEEYLKVQKMLSKRYKVQYKDTKYYFRNKVRCTCGCILEQKSTKKREKHYFYYVCQNCNARINQDYIISQTLYAISIETTKKEIANNTNKALKKLNAINRKIEDIHNLYISDKAELKIYLASLYRLEYEKKEQIAKINTSKLMDFIRWEHMSDLERIAFVKNHVKDVIVDTTAKVVINVEYVEKGK